MARALRMRSRGDFTAVKKLLNAIQKPKNIQAILDKYGQMGVDALEDYTPRDTGYTALSWTYRTSITDKGYSVEWLNDSMGTDGRTPIVILLTYGHGNGSGGYTEGQDFINPALRPVFDQLSEDLYREVTGN